MAVARRDNLHSRLVAFFKVVLPLVALAILSMLFLVSRGVNPEDAIPYADVDIADRVREPRLTQAVFAGMTADGAALTVQAAEARPEQGEAPMQASGLVGLLETPDGARTDLTAATAVLDAAAKRIDLGGGVVIATSGGYRVETDGLRVALDRTGLDSTGSVTATGPLGTLTAGALHVGQTAPDSATYVMVFKGGVKLVYLPAAQ